MNTTELVYALMQDRGGYLTTKDAQENGISNKTMQRIAEQGLIERAARGLYVNANVFLDSFYVMQYRCPKGFFSHETALFIHELSDREPLRLMMTIQSGANSKLLTCDSVRFFYNSPKMMRLGVCEAKSPLGMTVKVFDLERALCDCLKNIDRLDRDLILSALKRYAKSAKRDNARLLEYAAALNIRNTVYRYLEVLV